ncbi:MULTISPECIES: sterol desaturase family protein [Halomonadaceae]|uniref:sterol desaturase family protein n=1 Tax=Halomonadaceae TaxID=28256 RepID=UPI0015837585|nr:MULTISPECIES: sterol desaturase family protein [Halomonas]MDI4636803.1 sterol desaturase family protein [Halomonas sp. BMC7]NUJ61165.1 sterol desaturase family protein [Halomonas taeanensis]
MLLRHEPLIRAGAFACMLLTVALWEVIATRRPQRIHRRLRWPSNLAIVALGTLVVRLVFPLAAVGAALLATERGWGLFNLVSVPIWLTVIVCVIMLDVAIYFQHRLFHAVPWLWRLHRMHHADLEFDVTTGLRFHPLEILISMGIKLAVVTLLGAPALAVLIFEVLLNATSMFNHGNIRLPTRVGHWLRLVVVTPDMHRVHHSIVRQETDSNFSFNLPWWDRLFGTYRDQPAAGHLGMTIGIKAFRSAHDLRLDRMLLQPLVKENGANGRG